MRLTNFYGLSAAIAFLATIVTAAPSSPTTGFLRRTPGDTVLYPGGLGEPLNAGFSSSWAPSPLSTRVKLWSTSIPENCKSQALALYDGKPRCAKENIGVFEISFQDSPGRFWVVCRCNDSPVSQEVRLLRFIFLLYIDELSKH